MAQKQQVSTGSNRVLRTIAAVVFVTVIIFSAISICQNIGKGFKVDITDQKLYTLSGGTKSILGKLNQPIKAKLYYAKTAALKGPDQIRYFNNYYEFVKALLEEYAAVSKGKFELELIDPRPFSEDEVQALRYGLQRFPITQEENFFFGLVLQTQFGVEKAIPFFSPDRENFIEYDISYLIDTAITRQKRKIGVLSSIGVMGDDVSGYMAEMMMRQGQQPKGAWTFVEQLRKQYEVESVPTDVNDINDVDILLVVHPKDLPEKTLFAIDQFVLKGGRLIAFVDPHCFSDQPDQRMMQMGMQVSRSSELNTLLKPWGLEMPANTFAGDSTLAAMATIRANQRPEKIIGYLNLSPEGNCFNTDNVITAQLNQVRFLFSGVLREVADPNESAGITRTPLITTTNRGNSFSISNAYELMMLDPSSLMRKFVEGDKAVAMGYLINGKLKSSFPDGIEIEVEDESSDEEDPNDVKTVKKQITGLKEAQQDCAVAVFSDVDFISDSIAYQNAFFGKMVVGDNSALVLNTIDDLSGSGDLVSIRSRGNFKRPFVVVDEIERQAEEDTREEVDKINAQIAGFQNELQSILSSAKAGQEEVIGSSILQKQRDIELKQRRAQQQLNEVKLKKREQMEHLGNVLRGFNMLMTPAVILVIAIVLGIRRSVRKRHYISHASDA
ncbi:MAG: Gldg family protein [Planctomycetes bacterium]|nr:Gldg family protein [Planctomycetota bacterium]MBL7146936.1 Gldg family protein [Phycisphaerae bacterium]